MVVVLFWYLPSQYTTLPADILASAVPSKTLETTVSPTSVALPVVAVANLSITFTAVLPNAVYPPIVYT